MQHLLARLAALIFLLGPPAGWAQVPAPAPQKPAAKPAAPGPAARPAGPTSIEAEKIEGISELEVSARGKVELKRDDINVFSDFLRYNQEFGRVEADGGVRLERGADRFFGPRLRYDTANETGVFEEPTFILNRRQSARGAAERLEFFGRNRMLLNRAHYTSCAPGKEDWRIEARELELDYETETGTARDAKLRFLDTTIFALPYATFPLEHRRKTGILAPHYANSTRRGVEVGVPFYWNISPEYDMTLEPVNMSKRGVQLRNQFRYLGRSYTGDMRLEYLPDDRELRTNRSGFSYVHEHRFGDTMSGRLNLNKVSDDRYFVDFSSKVNTVSLGILPREGSLAYKDVWRGMPLYFESRVERFQTLQDPLSPIVAPYDRTPQIKFSAAKNDLGGLFDLNVPGEYVRFSHRTLVEGTRLSFNPTLSLPVLAPGYFLTPKIGLRNANYQLTRTAPGQPSRQDVSIPWTSVDAGLIFERETSLFGQRLTQTFEPRAYYVYVPYRAQDQIPLFDTALADFNYARLFTENRFSGGDRFGDANQFTLAATSRFLNSQGQELVRATVGQRFYFKNDRVTLDATTPPRTTDSSDIIASLGGRFFRDWTFDGTAQYSPRQERTDRYGMQLRYSPEIAKVINASYRFNRDLIRQVDISGQWPIFQGWYAIGRYNYSFRDSRLLEGVGGLEYNGGCWVFRAVFSRIQAASQTTTSAMFFQLELNGLGQIGSDDTVTFLKRNVPGYAVINPSEPALVPPSARPRLPFEQTF